MKQQSTTLLITNLPYEIPGAILSDPLEYFKHLASTCGTITRFKSPKDHILFITMLSVSEATQLMSMLKQIKGKQGLERIEVKFVEQRVKPFQVIGLGGDQIGLTDDYSKDENAQQKEHNELQSLWQIVDREQIESYVRWKDDGVWFFVVKMDLDPRNVIQEWQETLDEVASDEQKEYLWLEHLKTPLPVENTDPEGFTGKYKRIFLGHLTIGLEEQCVRSHFTTLGTIRHVQIPKKKDGRTKGIAFVDFYETISVKLALLKNKMYFADNFIVVSEATEERKSTRHDNGEMFMQGVSVVEAASSKHRQNFSHEQEFQAEEQQEAYEEEEDEEEPEVDTTQVFVANVTFEAPPRKLKKILKKCGSVLEFRPIVRDGEFMGKAFAKFETEEGVQEALKLHDTEFMGRPLIVREVRIDNEDGDRKRKHSGNHGGHRKKRRY